MPFLICGLFVGFASPSFSAACPQRDIQGIIQRGAGGATDNVDRALTPHVESFLGKKIVLANRPGGLPPFRAGTPISCPPPLPLRVN